VNRGGFSYSKLSFIFFLRADYPHLIQAEAIALPHLTTMFLNAIALSNL
jgi:hypothetical protein